MDPGKVAVMPRTALVTGGASGLGAAGRLGPVDVLVNSTRAVYDISGGRATY
jgi:hypothetical protein